MTVVNHPNASLSYELRDSQVESWLAAGWVRADEPAPRPEPVSAEDETEDDVPVDEPALTVEPAPKPSPSKRVKR